MEGHYANGKTNRFEWKNTIGPIEERPGHMNQNWGYRVSDGFGFHEMLQLTGGLGGGTSVRGQYGHGACVGGGLYPDRRIHPRGSRCDRVLQRRMPKLRNGARYGPRTAIPSLSISVYWKSGTRTIITVRKTITTRATTMLNVTNSSARPLRPSIPK